MFLTFTMVVLAEKEVCFVPKSVTGIMVSVLQCLIRSKHARAFGKHDVEYVVQAINKMKKLSFGGTMEGKVVFNEQDLALVQLTEEEVTDLAIVVPGGVEEISYKLLKTGYQTMFAHQSVQEILTALFIGQKPVKEFSEFIAKDLHKPEYSVIRRMLCGIFLDPDVFEQASGALLEVQGDLEEFRNVLVKSMFTEIEQIRKQSADCQLDLFRAIHEAGQGRKDIIPEDWHVIDLSYTPVTTSDMFTLASTISVCSNLRELTLWHCNLTDEALGSFAIKLQDSDLKIKKIDLARNALIGTRGMEIIGNIVERHETQDVGLVGCGLSLAQIKAFDEGLGKSTAINKIDVAYNKDVCSADFGDFVRRRRVKWLSMGHCGLTDERIKAFSEGLGEDSDLKAFDIGGNKGLGEAGLEILGKMIRTGSIKDVCLYECDLRFLIFKAFDKAIGHDTTIESLDVGFNRGMEQECFEAIGDFTRRREVQQLSLAHCLTYKEFEAFDKGLGVTELDLLDISWNHFLGRNGFSILGSLGRRCALQQLIAVETRLTAELLRLLDEGLAEAKLSLLDISCNDELSSKGTERAGEAGMEALAAIVKHHCIKALGIAGCKLTREDAIIFRNALGDYRIPQLLNKKWIQYLSSKLKQHDSQFPAMSELLPVVSECIDMSGWKLKKKDLNFLEERASQFPCDINASIKFGDKNHTEECLISDASYRFTQKGLLNRIVTSSQSVHQVNSEGGELKIGSCSIMFHPGTFSTSTKIWMKLEIDSSTWPEDYLCITPMLHVKAENPLTIPATVRLSSWCMNNGSKESKESKVDVLHRPEGSSKWEVIEQLFLNSHLVFQFDCLDFSPVGVGQSKDQLHLDCFIIEGFIFANKMNNFILVFCLGNKSIKDGMYGDIKQLGFEPQTQIARITVKYGDRLKTVIRCCSSANFNKKQDKEISNSFQINKDFIEILERNQFNFVLSSSCESHMELVMEYEIYKNDVVEVEEQCFQYFYHNPLVTESLKSEKIISISAATVVQGEAKATIQGVNFVVADSNTLKAIQNKALSSGTIEDLPKSSAYSSSTSTSMKEISSKDDVESDSLKREKQTQSVKGSKKRQLVGSGLLDNCGSRNLVVDNLHIGAEQVNIESKKRKTEDSNEV